MARRETIKLLILSTAAALTYIGVACLIPAPESSIAEIFLLALVHFSFFAVLAIRITGNAFPKSMGGLLPAIAGVPISAVYAFYTEELIWNSELYRMAPKMVAVNILLLLMLEMLVLFATGNFRAAYLSVVLCSWIYGLINFYVMKFRGVPPLYNDFAGAKTAMEVLKAYSLAPSLEVIEGSYMVLLFVSVNLLIKPTETLQSGNKNFAVRSASFAIVCLLSFGALKVNYLAWINASVYGFSTLEGFNECGAPLTMLISAQDSVLKKPENYSKESVQKLLSEYQSTENSATVTPTVIVIMNEAFSDLRVTGAFESEEFMPFLSSLSQSGYVMQGNVYVSVYAGGTSNSEYEMLTGNAAANLKPGSNPYVTLNLNRSSSLARLFADKGYETAAFHPYIKDSYNRPGAYMSLGFDEYIAADDFDEGYFDILGWTVSDESDYGTVIDIYNTKNKPSFIFNVTMQNHGSYEYELTNVEFIDVEESLSGYQDAVNYLSLIRESDKAFQKLLEYFSNVDEPVIICMFGDHQPYIGSGFLETINTHTGDTVEDVESKYIAPYIIWSNYDLGVSGVQKDMSLNYLGANLAKLAGIEDGYINYLLSLQEKIPVINAYGYMDASGEWHSLDEENEILNEYKIVQYYEMFDRDAS